MHLLDLERICRKNNRTYFASFEYYMSFFFFFNLDIHVWMQDKIVFIFLETFVLMFRKQRVVLNLHEYNWGW